MLWPMVAGTMAATLVACLAAAAVGQEAGSRALVKEFPPWEQACYGRAYDAAYLDRHRHRAISALYLLNDFPADPLAEMQHSTRQSPMNAHGTLFMFGRLRDGTPFHRSLSDCEAGKTGDALCHMSRDSDEEQGAIAIAPHDGALIVQHHFDLDHPDVRVRRGYDELVMIRHKHADFGGGLRLDPLPASACLAAWHGMRPPWANRGAPLSRRFADREAVCYVRRYGRAHLARHPHQRVAALAIRTAGRFNADPDREVALAVEVSVRLRDGARHHGKLSCWARVSGYAIDCGQDDVGFLGPVHGRTIRLLRAGHGSIDVWVPRFYHGAGDGKRTRLERLLDLDLGHDDQVFRLRESPAAACELP